MREILFKAKRVDNGEWVEGYVVKRHGLYFIYDVVNSDTCRQNVCEINPETLCQFTGLYDKIGRKIWENDIVEAWSRGSRAIGQIKQRIDGLWLMYPAWQNQELWELKPDDNGKTEAKILGNILDNPEFKDKRCPTWTRR